jgi:hypothetical protein
MFQGIDPGLRVAVRKSVRAGGLNLLVGLLLSGYLLVARVPLFWHQFSIYTLSGAILLTGIAVWLVLVGLFEAGSAFWWGHRATALRQQVQPTVMLLTTFVRVRSPFRAMPNLYQFFGVLEPRGTEDPQSSIWDLPLINPLRSDFLHPPILEKVEVSVYLAPGLFTPIVVQAGDQLFCSRPWFGYGLATR